MDRRGIIKGFAATVLLLQVGFAVNGYRDPHAFFAFQPFRESSTWRADIVRVTWDGERVPIDPAEWNELVDLPMLSNPFGTRERHASYGIGRQLDVVVEQKHHRLRKPGENPVERGQPAVGLAHEPEPRPASGEIVE